MADSFLRSVKSFDSLRSIRRSLVVFGSSALLLAIPAVGLLAARADAASPRAADHPAVACTDSWKVAAPGLWTTASNWSTGVVPTSSDNVCIKIAGTYAVTIVGSASAATITVGGTSGTQTLKIKGTPSSSSSLTLSSSTGSQIGVNGVVKLKSKNVAGSGYAEIAGGGAVTIVNKGLFETSGGTVSPDYLRVSVTNDSGGTVKINGTTADDGSGGSSTLTNNGTFSVGTSGVMTLTNGSSFIQNGGTFTNNGALNQQGGTFTQSGGADSGNPVSIIAATLSDSAGTGTFTFDMFSSDNLAGTIPSGQTVDVIGNTTYNSTTTLTSTLTNNGTLELDAQTAAGSGYTNLSGPSETITNNGTFETEGGTVSPDDLRTNVSNTSTGTVEIDGTTAEDGSGGATTLTNSGSFSVGSGGTLTLTNSSSFTQSAGTFANNGTFNQDSGTFTQSGGTDSGTPVTISNATLTDSAELGTFTFDLLASDNLGGTIPSGQTVDIIGSPTNNSTATLGANLTNDGTLEVDSETAAGSGYADLTGPTHTVTNAGTFETAGGTVSPDYLRTNVTNNSGGIVDIDGHTQQDASGGATTLTNNGTFSVGSTGILTLTNSSLFTQSGGTFTNNGALNQQGGTFTQSGGADSGNPVSIIAATLSDSAGTGTFTFDMFSSDNLAGTIPSGQTVEVIGNTTYNSDTALTSNLTIDGTLELDAQTAAGSGYAIISNPSDTITNNGTFETEGGTVSPDYLRTNVTNASGGTVDIDGVTTDDASGGVTTLTNNGILSVGDGDAITVSNGSKVTQSSTGTFEPTVDASTGVFGIIGGVDTVAGTLDVNTVGAPTVGSMYNVIGSATSVTGTFSSVTGSYTVSYSSTAVTVKVT